MMRALLSFLLGLSVIASMAQVTKQPVMDPAVPLEYEIGGITVSGTRTTDPNAVKLFTGLQVGDKVTIPGERISRAIENLWEQKLFSDISIEAAEIRGRTIFLHIIVTEKPRLSRFKFEGVTKNEGDKLRDEIQLIRGQQVNDAVVANTRTVIRKYFVEKGFLRTTVDIIQRADTARTAPENSDLLIIKVEKGPKVKIKEVEFVGNESVSDRRLRRAMKKTRRKRWYNLFGGSKFISNEFKADKNAVLDVYNEKGYRNAAIVKDTVYDVSSKRIGVRVTMDEGAKFHWRNVSITGNTKHSTDTLLSILNIQKGDVYNKKLLDSRLYMNPTGRDITSLYMDDGYLSFYPDPVELLVEGDSIDLDLRIREGRQFRIRSILIKGNSKTNEHVIRREIRTKPGQLFNRSDVIRTQRELSTLGYFNPETLCAGPGSDSRPRSPG